MEQVWLTKILRELSINRSRTALTVLSIAVGLFAVSLTFRTQAILSRNVLGFYSTSVPAALVIQVAPADPEIAEVLSRVDGVQAVQGVQRISARANINGTWRALALTGIDDMDAIQVNLVTAESGAWPAPDQAMLLEGSYLENAGVQVGDALEIELDDGSRHTLPIAGTAHDLSVISGRFGGPVLQGYLSLDTAERFTGSRSVNEFLIAVDSDQGEATQRQAVADRVRERLREAGAAILHFRIRDPSAPETYPIITAVFQMLTALGVMSLALSACLVINTTSAMLARHGIQIGVMKAVGARSRDIFRMYLTLVLLIALVALLIALPPAALCAWLLARQLAWLLNYTIQDVDVPLSVVAIELAAGILTPLLASVFPISTAARITVREALSGVGASPLGSGVPKLLSTPLPGVPIGMLYAARNMFRRKGRLALTLAALMCGGAIEMTVASTQASLLATLDQVSNYWQQDLTASFNQSEGAARVIAEAEKVPGVVAVERQSATLAVRKRPDGSDSENRYAIFGVKPDSALLQPTLLLGRWLTPADTNAIVINVDLVKYEPGLTLGNQLALTIDGRTTNWEVVGVVTTHMLIYGDSSPGQGVGYVNSDTFTRLIDRAQQTNRILITTMQHDAAFRKQISTALEAHFAEVGIQVLVQTQDDIRSQIAGFVSLLVVLLLVMALSFVAIGALSLVGAMSLNVLERTKEIGILRVIGSSHRHVASIVVIEGICIGVLSWIPATLLALPLSRFLSEVLGWSMLSWPLVYIFPPTAPLLWLVIVILLSAGASYLPAQRAAQSNVRDALDYQ
jgi:putative ABC transport system permease protein